MKVNLECGKNIRNSYLNICSWPALTNEKDLPEHTQFAMGQFKNLDPILQDDSVEEMIFNPPVNLLTPQDIVTVLQHWRKKLKENGKLSLFLIDIRKVGLGVHSGELDLQQADGLIFGPHHIYNCLVDTSILLDLLKGLQFKIEAVGMGDYTATIEATKHDEAVKN